MSLTPAERRAGRLFRDAQAAVLATLNETEPPGILVTSVLHYVRHNCPSRGGVSTALELKEHYELNPEYWVCYCSVVEPFVPYVFPHRDCDGGKPVTEPGRFGYIWKQGRCPACQLTARSRDGRFVITAERPPDTRSIIGRPDEPGGAG